MTTKKNPNLEVFQLRFDLERAREGRFQAESKLATLREAFRILFEEPNEEIRNLQSEMQRCKDRLDTIESDIRSLEDKTSENE